MPPDTDTRSFTVARLIRDAFGFFGYPNYVAAGALSTHDPTSTMTVAAAYAEIIAWLGSVPGGGGGGGGGASTVVGTTLAELGSGGNGILFGLLRLGTWPNTHDELFFWHDGPPGKWVGEEHVVVTQSDTHAMDLGNRKAADLTQYSRIDNAIPYGKAFTMLNGAQNLSTGAFSGGTGVLTVVSSAGMGGGRPTFPAAGTLYIRDNAITYTGKTPTTFTGCTLVSGSGGTIPDATDVVSGGVGGWGFTISPLMFVSDLWAAGFRLQEQAVALMNAAPDGTHQLTVAPYWYEFNDGDGLSVAAAVPPTGGIGVSAPLVSIADGGGVKNGERTFFKKENPWTDWAAGIPTKRYMLPMMIGKMAAGSTDTGEVLDLKLTMRWVSP